LLVKLTEKHSLEYNNLSDRYKEAKSIYYNLNNIKIEEKDKEEKKKKRIELMKALFEENLGFLKKISDEIKQAISNDISGLQNKDQQKIKDLDRQIETIYKNSWRFQVEGKKVENIDKIFSIYEQHTDIIVKGLRECLFGHKVNISSGKSNLILDCDVVKGNPSDVNLFLKPLENIQETYQRQIGSIAHDGGYASLENQADAQNLNIKNIVFTKVVGSLQNIVESPVKEKFLHCFRAGAEAIISNLKRGFDLVRVDWKGFEMFKAKVYWGVVGYNIRILAGHILETLFPKPAKG
jgi:transposase, IS5 family